MPINTSKVPTLQVLAAREIQKSNPNLFFRLQSLETDPEIKKAFIEPKLQTLTNQVTKEYQIKVEAREEKIEKCSSSLSSDSCFAKCSSLTLATLLSGVHVGIYYMLKAADVDPSAQTTFICTIPATICFSICAGVCLNKQIAKCLASCFTPSVPNKITIDLDEVGRKSDFETAAKIV